MLQLTTTNIRKPYFLQQKLEPDIDQTFQEVAFCVRSFPADPNEFLLKTGAKMETYLLWANMFRIREKPFLGIVRVTRPQIWDLRRHILTRKCDLKLNVMCN